MELHRLGLVAGEASGDLIGASLLGALRERWPGLQAGGIGGPKLVAQGFQAWWPAERLSVFGYMDALKRLPELLRIRRQAGTRWLAERPQLFIGVDAPDFNFGLEKRLRQGGLKTVHYVCPSIWAWRPERVDTIRAAADHVLCLFPFEPELLRGAGIRASFVGHPLASQIPAERPRAASRAALGLDEGASVLALLPGSRRSEVSLIGPPLLQAAELLVKRNPGLIVLLPVAPGLRALVEQTWREHAPALPLQLVDGQAHAVLGAADAAIVASGTATLEAALLQCPQVIAYRVSAMNAWRMRGKQLQPWVGLPNVLAREFIVPELLQERCQPQALADAAQAWLDDPQACARLRERCQALHQSLRADTAQLCLDAIAQTLAS